MQEAPPLPVAAPGTSATAANATKSAAEPDTAAAGPPAYATSDKHFTCQCSVDYGSQAHAEMIMRALSVDKELRPNQVTRTFHVDGGTLTIRFAATDARTLRSAVGSLCDLMGLATRTLEAFGPKV